MENLNFCVDTQRFIAPGLLDIHGNITDEDLSFLKKEQEYERVLLKRCETDNLEFLARNAPNLKSLVIRGNIPDISALERMHSLSYLKLLDFKKTVIDFSKMKGLKTVIILDYTKSFASVFRSESLESLELRGFPEKDFSHLSGLKNLVSLEFYFGSLVNMDGIENLPSLEKVAISYFRSLVDVKAMDGIKKLNHLEIAKCPKLTAEMILEQIPKSIKHRHPMPFHTENKDLKAIPVENGGELSLK